MTNPTDTEWDTVSEQIIKDRADTWQALADHDAGKLTINTSTNNNRWFKLTDEEADKLNNPDPREVWPDEDGIEWERHYYNAEWISLGSVPTPRTRLGWFFHHVAHGLMMRYPPHKVLGWSFWHSFIEPFDLSNPMVVYVDEEFSE